MPAVWKSSATWREERCAPGTQGQGAAQAARRPRCVVMVAACPFPSLRGSQVLIRELAERLAASGHRVHIVTYPTAQHIVPVRQIAIHRLPALPGLRTARPFTWRKAVLDLLLVARARRVARQVGAEIVHGHNGEGGLVALAVRALSGLPAVYHAHNALADELPAYARRPSVRALLARVGGWLDAFIARRADLCVTPTRRLAAYLAARGAAGRVRVQVPCAGGLPRPEPPRDGQGAGGGGAGRRSSPRILYAGNLDPYQGLEVLLDGFRLVRRRIPGARLVLVTHPGDWERTRLLACRLGRVPGVRVVDAPAFPAMLRLAREADVLVAPRGSWSGFPIKVLNYLCTGVPIVHSRAVGAALGGAAGFVFESGDPQDLAAAVERALGQPDRGRDLARQAALRLAGAAAPPEALYEGWSGRKLEKKR